MNSYQSVFTLKGENLTIDPSWGLTKLEIVANTPTPQPIILTGNCVLGNGESDNIKSQPIQLLTPYTIQSTGNTPLGNIKIEVGSQCVLIGYK